MFAVAAGAVWYQLCPYFRLVEEGHPEMEAAHVAMLHNGELF